MWTRLASALLLGVCSAPTALAQLSSAHPAAPPLAPAGSNTALGACGIYDDGVSENALGLTAGGEAGWLHFIPCLHDVHAIETAYGTPAASSPPNGSASRLVLYRDPSCSGDPTSGPLTLEFSIATTVTNAGTDLFNRHPLACPIDYSGTCNWVLATADHAPAEFPGPMDTTNPYDGAWVVGSTTGPGTLDIQDLSSNSVAPIKMNAAGFPAAWLLRVDGAIYEHFYSIACLSDCTGSPCPCGNVGDFDEGCANSTGAGSQLFASSPSFPSVSNDQLSLEATQLPDQPGIFFQGDDYLGSQPFLGAGIRCCGENVVRWTSVLAQGGCASTDQPGGCGIQVGGVGGSIAALAGLSAGDTRCYQYWYRDPGGPCAGTSFNLTPGIIFTWGP